MRRVISHAMRTFDGRFRHEPTASTSSRHPQIQVPGPDVLDFKLQQLAKIQRRSTEAIKSESAHAACGTGARAQGRSFFQSQPTITQILDSAKVGRHPTCGFSFS
jgi:hypothetical protein